MNKEIKISSIPDLLNYINDHGPFSMYRGQSNSEWQLIPSIGRMKMGKAIFVDWNTFEEHLLNQFKKYSIPFLSTEPKNDVDWLIIAQHHGLPTRMLDWTMNPLKGLFFALQDLSTDGSLFTFEKTAWYDNLDSLNKIRRVSAFYPKHINTRLIAQDGCFTIHSFPPKRKGIASFRPLVPIEKDNPNECGIKNLTKFIISKNEKAKLTMDLHNLGINYHSLFPDLDGLTLHLKWRIENDI